MDAANIFSYLADYGFPVILSWYLLVRMEGKLDRLTEVIGELATSVATMWNLKPRPLS